jgi:hypothetical protein
MPPSYWDCRYEPPQLAYLLRWSFTNFLPGLASNHNPLDLCLTSSLDYRLEPPFLVRDILFKDTLISCYTRIPRRLVGKTNIDIYIYNVNIYIYIYNAL